MDRPGVRQVPEGSGEQGKNGENWLQNHLWCPNDPRGLGIDDDDDGDCKSKFYCQYMPSFVVLGLVISNSKQHSEFGCQEISGTEDNHKIHKDSVKV